VSKKTKPTAGLPAVGCEIVLLLVYASNLPPPMACRMTAPSHATRAGVVVRFIMRFRCAVSGLMNPGEI
jgi:hypothetical protein